MQVIYSHFKGVFVLYTCIAFRGREIENRGHRLEYWRFLDGKVHLVAAGIDNPFSKADSLKVSFRKMTERYRKLWNPEVIEVT